MEKKENNIKVKVYTKLLNQRKVRLEDIKSKWEIKENLNDFKIYRKIEEITEQFVIVEDKAWFETKFQDKTKKCNLSHFVLPDKNALELISKGYTTVTSFVIEDTQNGSLFLWNSPDLPEDFEIVATVVTDYTTKKFFKPERNCQNKWFLDVNLYHFIAKKDDYVYILNLQNGEETLKKGDTFLYIRHYNLLNLNEFNFDLYEDDIKLNFNTKKTFEVVPTE